MHEPTIHERQACFMLCAVIERLQRRVLKRLPARSASSDEQDGGLLKDRVTAMRIAERKDSAIFMINAYATKGRAGHHAWHHAWLDAWQARREGQRGDWASSLVEDLGTGSGCAERLGQGFRLAAQVGVQGPDSRHGEPHRLLRARSRFSELVSTEWDLC